MKFSPLVLGIIALLGFMFVLNCFGTGGPPMPVKVDETVNQLIPVTAHHIKKGFSVSPQSFGREGFENFFEIVNETSDVVVWAGDWIHLSDKRSSPYVFTELSRQYNYVPIIEVGHYIQSTGLDIRPFDEEIQKEYYDSTINFVSKYKPKYFGMGVEINIFARQNPKSFEKFVDFYSDVYYGIKNVSPRTKVFTVYQLEAMKGLPMWKKGAGAPQWDMIDRFPCDVVAFTTYPNVFYQDVSELKEDHYTEIMNHTNLSIIFTEIGWHSSNFPKGWESSEDEQREFVSQFFNLTSELPLDVAVWSFMYDPKIVAPFDSSGLIYKNGTRKPGWDEWVNFTTY